MYWHPDYLSLFGYAIISLQIGMAFVLSLRISSMYMQLEQSNVILEAAVIERTRELEEQTAISRQASEAKSQFMATMSHEIRTPINAVIGLSAAELMGGLPDTTRDNISQIYESGSILLGIINDILDISKIEAGRFELSPSVYETATLLHYVSYLNMVRIGSKPIRFSLEVGADFPQKLKGDELRVKQVLNNLISNAIKYTDQGTVTLSATWEPSPSADGGAVIRFAVRDTGVGIPAEDLARLFDSYTQLDAGAARKTEGTGLGLTIAKNLAEMMDGKIAVESACGSGSVFTAEIAQGLADSTGIGQKTAEDLQNFRYKPAMEDEIKIARQWMPSAKALVVDDIKANRNVAKGLLAAYGLAVDTAASGPEGIELAKQNAYDIVFMDHMMPEMDGVQAARVIKGLGASVPIVAMTAGAMLGMREYYLQQGFDDYLSKPVTLKALDELILRWIPTKKWASRPDAPPDARLPKNDNFAAEIDTQRIDTLNHYRASFERWQGQDEAPDGVRPDSSYFERFAAFIETLDVAGSPSLELQASTLADAGRRGDATKIKELLPAFFENLKNRPESGQDMEASAMIALGAILIRLKAAVLDGKTEEAEKILSEMGALELKGAGRDLYFLLYDMLLADGAEKAIGAISLWEKLSLARYHKA
jgi:signal transduction histidine kinase/CheY-like chemotaxis protein